MKRLRWGIKTVQQHTTYEAIVRVWQEADRNPAFEHAWIFDHFSPIQGDLDGPCLEGWTLLSALAAQTRRLELGMMVVGNTYRNPAINARMAATVDVISNGRLQFGIGAGWSEYEHESMGIPLYQPGERLRRLRESCEIARLLFTQPVSDFDGQYYQLKQARCEPKPVQRPYPPFVIGGGGEKVTLRIAAQFADIWNTYGTDVEEFRHKVEVLHGHCAAIGRDPEEIELSVQTRIDPANMAATAIALEPFIAAGASHLILMVAYPYAEGIVEQLVHEVIERVGR